MPTDQLNKHILLPTQVPDFPSSCTWLDELRWSVTVVDSDSRDLGFLASLLSYVAENGGLTERQCKYARRAIDRVKADWMADRLACQRQARPTEIHADLATAAPAGRA